PTALSRGPSAARDPDSSDHRLPHPPRPGRRGYCRNTASRGRRNSLPPAYRHRAPPLPVVPTLRRRGRLHPDQLGTTHHRAHQSTPLRRCCSSHRPLRDLPAVSRRVIGPTAVITAAVLPEHHENRVRLSG